MLSFAVHPLARVLVGNHSDTYLHCAAQFSPDLLRSETQLLDETAANTTTPSEFPEPTIVYSWLRNERPLALRNSHFKAFANGTLRLEHSKIATGRYRCIADDRTYHSGAIVSATAVVQQAGEHIADKYVHYLTQCQSYSSCSPNSIQNDFVGRQCNDWLSRRFGCDCVSFCERSAGHYQLVVSPQFDANRGPGEWQASEI